MIDLYDELKQLIANLDRQAISYALCGGLAMAVYGVARATVDIDLLVRPADLERIRSMVGELGYTIEAKPMTFSKGAVEIRRFSKLDPALGDPLSLDLLLVTGALEEIWDQRRELAWEEGPISVVSREGLIHLKSLRSSAQDRADIEQLENLDES